MARPSTFADLINSARSEVNEISKTSVDSNNESTIQPFVSLKTDTNLRLSLLTKPDQLQFIQDGKIYVLSAPLVAANANNVALVYGSLGDNITTPTPVSIPLSDASSFFISFTRAEDAQRLDLPASPSALATLVSPEDEQLTPGDIGWPAHATANTDAPTVAVFPKVFPINGKPILHNHDLTTELPDQLRVENPDLHAWASAAQWLLVHNDNLSLEGHDKSIAFASLDAAAFADLPSTSGDTPNIASSGLVSTDPMFANFSTHFERQTKTYLLNYALANNLPAPAPEARSTLPANDAIHSLAEALRENKKSQTEKERDEEAAIVCNRFRALFAALKPDPNDPNNTQVVVPELNPSFSKMLRLNRLSQASTLLSDIYQNVGTQLITSDSFLAATYEAQPELQTDFLTSCIRKFQFADEPYTSSPAQMRTKLGLLHFARPKDAAPEYQDLVLNNETVRAQLMVEEEAKHKTQKSSELFIQRALESKEDIVAMLSGFWAFTTAALGPSIYNSDQPTPLLWEVLLEAHRSLRTSLASKWLRRHRNETRVWYHLVSDLQSILQTFVGLSKNSLITDAIATNSQLSPTSYVQAATYARAAITRMANIFYTGGLGEYRDPNPIQSYLNPTSITPATPTKARSETGEPASKAAKISPDNKSKPSNKKQLSDDEKDALKKKGMLRYTGTGRPPAASLMVDKNGETTYICSNWVTQGFVCTRQDCKFSHPRNIADIKPAAKREEYKKWVSETENLEFVGSTPATANG